jgi:hypothetical protein
VGGAVAATAPEEALESDANRAAASALASLWSSALGVEQLGSGAGRGSKPERAANPDAIGARATGGARQPILMAARGLRLQRCKSDPNMGVTWSGPRIAKAEVPHKLLEYDVQLALLEARRADLHAKPESGGELPRIEETLAAFKYIRGELQQAAASASPGEDLVWFESQLGFVGWLPLHFAVQQSSAEADPSWQSGLRTAQRYRILTEQRGASQIEAAAKLGLVTAGEFVGVTQIVEAYRGEEAITGRVLSPAERVMRAVTGVIQVGSLAAGGGGPRLSSWAARIRGAEIRWVQPIGPGRHCRSS